MRNCTQLILIAVAVCCSLYAFDTDAAIINAASCTKAAVQAAYNSALAGDTISIPAGDCDTTNKWSGYINVTKQVTIEGAGQGVTIIGLSGAGGFSITANGVSIGGMTFEGHYINSTSNGAIRVGTLSGCPTYEYKDWRIHHITFHQFGASGGNTTGREALTLQGEVYGVIDNNIFTDCNGEIMNMCSDGTRGKDRSNLPGQYDNGTIYVEDNTFNANAPVAYENTIDGNSSQRFVFRYNTINIANGAYYASGIVSTHETCALCTGLSGTCGDAGSAAYEMYENTINLNTTGSMRDLGIVRGGRALIYNNHIKYSGSSSGRYDVASWISNYRSMHYNNICGSAAHARGYGQFCHETDGSYTAEGRALNKSTLNGALGNDTGCPTVASVTDFPTYGGSIIVESEQIDYTAIVGSTLTPCTRGANGMTRAAHNDGTSVTLLIFGQCLEQPNNVWIYNNDINGVVSSAMNNVSICGRSCAGTSGMDFTKYDIKSYAERPANWQYRNDGTAYSYTPYPYPHPLRSGVSAPSAPQGLIITPSN